MILSSKELNLKNPYLTKSAQIAKPAKNPKPLGIMNKKTKNQRKTQEESEIDTLAPPQTHYEITDENNNMITHLSKIDKSFVDYMTDTDRGTFMIYFDQALFEPPQAVLDLEAELEKKEKEMEAKIEAK